jgi:hypothetical protein
MSTHTADPAAPDHPFEPEWNPTPTNGELTAELGNPFREELQVNTSLEIDPSVEAMLADIEQQNQPKPDPLTDGYPVGGPGQIKAATPKSAGSVMAEAIVGLAEAVTAPKSVTAAQESPKDPQAVSGPLSPTDEAAPADPKLRESARGDGGGGYFEPDEAARTDKAKTVDPVGKAKDRVEEREVALKKAQELEEAGAPLLAANQRKVAERYDRKLGQLPRPDSSAK